MAEDKDPKNAAAQDDKAAEKQRRKEEKARRKQEKKQEKEKAQEASENEEEKAGGKLVLFFVTVLIIAIWLGIIAILIKSDVGGFGSSVLYPVLKDVPYVNRILPEPESDYEQEDSETPYRSLEDALARIKELEQELDDALGQNSADSRTIEDMQKQIDELALYRDEQAEFEKEKEKFYEEVVLSDDAPDINEYRAYYESIDPENAAVLYKQVIEQISYDETVQDYVKAYSQMQPKDAAEIFNEMTDNLGLVADILTNMGTKTRADILAEMDVETAARLTEIMEPKKR